MSQNCMGFSVVTIENNKPIEQLFAIDEQGKVYESVPREFSHSFTSGQTWRESGKDQVWVHTNTEFIGNYEMSEVLKKM